MTFLSITKYCQVYKRFWIHPYDVLLAEAENAAQPKTPSPSIIEKLRSITGRKFELDMLEELALMQWERIAQLHTSEEVNEQAAKLLVPEINALKDILDTLMKSKAALGEPGYERIPNAVQNWFVNSQFHYKPSPRVEMLTPEQRAQFIDLGTMLMDAIEKIRKNEPLTVPTKNGEEKLN